MDTIGTKPLRATKGSLALEELNLVEFPLVVLAEYAPKDQKVLQFSDCIDDAASGEKLNRTVTIAAAADSQLPAAHDQDILLALMKLTDEKNGFQEREVNFTLYELCKILRWSKSGDRYERLAESLDRWLGVTIRFSHWRFKDQWMKKKGFHILEHYELTRKKNFEPDEPQTFMWNELVCNNLRNGHSKSIDWDFYLDLKSPVAKRLYRFLDKRFYMKHAWKFDLADFGWNKVGISQECRVSSMKQRLRAGVKELERKGFLAAMNESDRFHRLGKGRYEVTFKSVPKRKSLPRPQVMPAAKTENPLEAALLARGVTNATALVTNHEAEKITRQMENFDHRQKEGEGLSGGWLRKAIEENYGVLKGFKTKSEREEEAKRLAAIKERRAKREAAEVAQREAAEQAKQEAFEKFIKSLGSDEARKEFQEESLGKSGFVRQYYVKAKKENDATGMATYLEMSAKSHWEALMKAKGKSSGNERSRKEL